MTNKGACEYVEKNFPEMVSEYRKIMEEDYEVFCAKQYDYGSGNIALGTDLKKKDDIRLALVGLVVRLNDKVNRLINLVVKRPNEKPMNESVEDAFRDTSVYGIIARIVDRGKWGK